MWFLATKYDKSSTYCYNNYCYNNNNLLVIPDWEVIPPILIDNIDTTKKLQTLNFDVTENGAIRVRSAPKFGDWESSTWRFRIFGPKNTNVRIGKNQNYVFPRDGVKKRMYQHMRENSPHVMPHPFIYPVP